MDSVSRARVERSLPSYTPKDGLLYYEEKLYVPQKNICDILQLAHDNQASGHFGTSKTLSSLISFYWPHKSRDVDHTVKVSLYASATKTVVQNRLAHLNHWKYQTDAGAQLRWTSLPTYPSCLSVSIESPHMSTALQSWSTLYPPNHPTRQKTLHIISFAICYVSVVSQTTWSPTAILNLQLSFESRFYTAVVSKPKWQHQNTHEQMG